MIVFNIYFDFSWKSDHSSWFLLRSSIFLNKFYFLDIVVKPNFETLSVETFQDVLNQQRIRTFQTSNKIFLFATYIISFSTCRVSRFNTFVNTFSAEMYTYIFLFLRLKFLTCSKSDQNNDYNNNETPFHI